MRKNTFIKIFIIVFVAILNVSVARYSEHTEEQKIDIHMQYKADRETTLQTFFCQEGQNADQVFVNQHIDVSYSDIGEWQEVIFSIPADTVILRFDPAAEQGINVSFKNIQCYYGNKFLYDLDKTSVNITTGEDEQIFWNLNPQQVIPAIKEARATQNIMKKILVCSVLDVLMVFILVKWSSIVVIPGEIKQNRKLIWNLAKNDFKQKFAGSYLGIIWAFVNPIVTVIVYWFVFAKALNAGTASTKAGIEVPFVLWLIAGLVPWFYFSEVLSAGTNALVDYNYLVKKVVFKISTLPVVKILSSLFVHGFFIAFMLILYSCYHYYPTWYTLQIIYYSFAMMMLALGIVYATSAMMVFFRDLGQLISVLLQILMWMTPIMWNMDAMINRIPKVVVYLLKLNPMYYIVNGYRDSLISQIGFWEHPGMTIYFWTLTIICFVGGMSIFRRLQQHFADVL